MNKKLIAVAAAGLLALTGTGSSVAQDGVVFVPVDVFGCKYNEGRGPEDIDAAAAAFNEYMDDNNRDNYAAWTMTKHYAGPDQDFDFIWLGAHKNGTSMGEGADMWEASGGEILAKFQAASTCATAGNYASRMFKAPPDGNVPADGIITMSNCTVEEGAEYSAVIAASEQWAQIMGDAGSQVATYHWYPIYGTGEHDISYKLVRAYPNHAELGKDYDRMGNGGMYMQSQELFGDIVDCDVTRVYDAKLRRGAQIRD